MTEQAVPAAQSETSSGDQWHRLKPLSILHYMVMGFKLVLDQGINLLPALAVGITFFREKTGAALIWIGVAIAILALIFGVLTYLRFRYRMQGSSFLVRKGVLSVKRLTLDFDRVQSINIGEPIYFRPFGMAVLKLESAGSAGSEVSLNGIPRAQAQSIRTRILNHQKEHTVEPEDQGSDADPLSDGDTKVFLTRSVGDIVRYGLSNNQVWFFAGIVGSFIGSQIENLSRLYTPAVRAVVETISGFGSVGKGAVILVGILFIACILLLISVLSALLRYYDYRLTRDGGRLIRNSGFGERKEASLKESKLQTVRLGQNFMARLLNRRHLFLIHAGGIQNSPANAVEPGFMIPSLKSSEEASIVSSFLPGIDPHAFNFKPIDSRFILRSFVMFFGIPFLVLGTICALAVGPEWLALSLVCFLFLPFVILRHRRYGYAVTPEFAAVKSGIIGQGVSYFALKKVQHISLGQSPSERRHKLASITVRLAGATVKIPYMPEQDAKLMMDHIVKAVESNNQPWM